MSLVNLPSPSRLMAVLLVAASAAAAHAEGTPSASMLTMAQAVTIAESTQNGIAFGMKRATAGTDVVYRVKVSTPDRGIVEVQVAAYGGRVELAPREHRRTPA